MRPGLTVERIDQDRAGRNQEREQRDHVEWPVAERAAQQGADAALALEVAGIGGYGSLTHVFSP